MYTKLLQTVIVIHIFLHIGEVIYYHTCVGDRWWNIFTSFVIRDSAYCRELRTVLTSSSVLYNTVFQSIGAWLQTIFKTIF